MSAQVINILKKNLFLKNFIDPFHEKLSFQKNARKSNLRLILYKNTYISIFCKKKHFLIETESFYEP